MKKNPSRLYLSFILFFLAFFFKQRKVFFFFFCYSLPKIISPRLFFCVFVVLLCGVFLSSSYSSCGLCRLSMTIWFPLSCCNAFLCESDLNCKVDPIKYRHQVKSWLSIHNIIEVICTLVIIKLSNVYALSWFIVLST